MMASLDFELLQFMLRPGAMTSQAHAAVVFTGDEPESSRLAAKGERILPCQPQASCRKARASATMAWRYFRCFGRRRRRRRRRCLASRGTKFALPSRIEYGHGCLARA